MTHSLEGKSAIVTGAASGIGRAAALLFAKAGASVTLADRNAEGLEETLEQVKAAGGVARSVTTDVSDASQV